MKNDENRFHKVKAHKTKEHHDHPDHHPKHMTKIKPARPMYNIKRSDIPPKIAELNKLAPIHEPDHGKLPPSAAIINGKPAESALAGGLVPDKKEPFEFIRSTQTQPLLGGPNSSVISTSQLEVSPNSELGKVVARIQLNLLDGKQLKKLRLGRRVRTDEVAIKHAGISGPGAPNIVFPRFSEVHQTVAAAKGEDADELSELRAQENSESVSEGEFGVQSADPSEWVDPNENDFGDDEDRKQEESGMEEHPHSPEPLDLSKDDISPPAKSVRSLAERDAEVVGKDVEVGDPIPI